jgi:hypothetical protein
MQNFSKFQNIMKMKVKNGLTTFSKNKKKYIFSSKGSHNYQLDSAMD